MVTTTEDAVAASQRAAPEAKAEARPSRAWARWGVLALLAVGALIAFVDRINISAALTTGPFKEHFSLTNVDRGWINSAFFWSYALFQVPMGWAVDRFGVKRPYAICFVIWCLASAAIGLMPALWGLILMRLLVGAAEAVVVPASYRWIRNNFHPDNSGAAVGVYMLGAKFGPAIGAPLAAWLIVHLNWQLMFLITGLAGLVWLVPWMLAVKSDLPTRAAATVAAAKKKVDVSILTILSSPLVWGTLVVNFCYNYFTFFCMTWMPAYLVEQRGLSLEQMGLYTFYSFMGIALVALASGYAADKLIQRYGRPVLIRKIFVVAGFAIACTVLLGARATDVNTALFWNVASLSGLGLTTANNLALCSLTLIPAPIVGRVKGVQNVATALAGGVAPLITGWLLHATGSFVAPMTLIFAFLVLGALTVIVMLRPEWAPKVPDDAEAKA
ncbi:MFS transporter [Caulobacter hibisci]|uniref:MFS transporter n=1 Tax=Caulobacter hibisci TaxID=2035993 RepID=UPI0018E39BAC